MKRRVLVALALSLACAPALAQKADSSAPYRPWTAAHGFDWVEAEGMPDSGLVHLGRLAVDLEYSPLKNLAATAGGRTAHSGDASTALTWICLHADGDKFDTRIWLTSDEMGGGKINGVTMARLPASSAPEAGCPAIKPEHATIRLPGDLKLGASEASLRAQLGKTSYDKGGIVAFARIFDLGVPASEGGPCQLGISAWFKFEGGVATALELGRSSAC